MLEAEGHVAAQTERHDIAAEELTKADDVPPAAHAFLPDARIGVVEEPAAIGADEHALATERGTTLTAAPLIHRRHARR